METRTPRRTIQRLILQNSAAVDYLTPQNRYSILESSRSFGKLSVLGKIKLEEEIRSLSQPKLMTIKEDLTVPLSALSTKRDSSQQSPSLRFTQQHQKIEELTYQQKLVQVKLRQKNLEYEKLLILQAELDLQIIQQSYKNKGCEEKINKSRLNINEIVKQIQQKRSAISKAKNDVKICYVHLGRIVNPDDPEKQYRQKVQRQQQRIAQFQSSKKFFAEQSASYDQEVFNKTRELEYLKKRIQQTKENLEKTKNSRLALLKQNSEIQLKNKLNRLQYEKLTLSVASIKEQQDQLTKWAGYIQYFLQVGEKLKALPELHIDCSKQIQNQIFDFMRHDCSKVNYEFPRLLSSIRESQSKKAKLKYKIEVQNKKIALLQAKIARCEKYFQQEANPQQDRENI